MANPLESLANPKVDCHAPRFRNTSAIQYPRLSTGCYMSETARRSLIAGLAVLCLCRAGSASDDWSQFRGANASGVSTSIDLPVEFDLTRDVSWEVNIARGHSSP